MKKNIVGGIHLVVITRDSNKTRLLNQKHMSNRKYIHLHLCRVNFGLVEAKINGKDLLLEKADWGNLNQGSKKLALAICKELYPCHENDLYEKFLKDYISKLKDSDIVEVNVDITEFCQYAREVIRIKQEAGVESIEDILPF